MNEQPIGRYIAIAFIFVLLFIGVAYLAYRFTRPNTGGNIVFPVATPTPTAPPATGGGTVVLLPPPNQQPINPYIPANRVYFSPQPIVKQVNTGTNTTSNGQSALIIHDGKGNVLVNNLTHEEFFQLERERIQTNRDLALAKENNARSLNEAKLQQETAARQTQANAQQTQQQLAQQAQSAQLTYLTELARLNQQGNASRLNQQIELARVNQQDTTAKLNQQIELARLQQQAQSQQQTNQLEQARLQQNYKTQQLTFDNDYRTTIAQQAYDLAKLRNNLYFGQLGHSSQGSGTTGYSYY
jgi:hypothetical protein